MNAVTLQVATFDEVKLPGVIPMVDRRNAW
jgi:hypothetical protein